MSRKSARLSDIAQQEAVVTEAAGTKAAADTVHQPVLSDSSSSTLISPTCTPDYDPATALNMQRSSLILSRDEEQAVVTELMGFAARKLLFDVHDTANTAVFDQLMKLDEFLTKKTNFLPPNITSNSTPSIEDYEREVTTGLHEVETLLTTKFDTAFDRFLAWGLRNAFNIGTDNGVKIVLPVHEGLDFRRGHYVATMPGGGQKVVEETIEELRAKVEHKRKLKALLLQAEQKLELRKAKTQAQIASINFYRETVEKHGLYPLSTSTQPLVDIIQSLHQTISTLPSAPLPSKSSSSSAVQSYKDLALAALVPEKVAAEAAERELNNIEKGIGDIVGDEGVEGGAEGAKRLGDEIQPPAPSKRARTSGSFA